MIKMLLFTQM